MSIAVACGCDCVNRGRARWGMPNMDGRNADPLTVDVGLSTEREEMMSVDLFICLFLLILLHYLQEVSSGQNCSKVSSTTSRNKN